MAGQLRRDDKDVIRGCQALRARIGLEVSGGQRDVGACGLRIGILDGELDQRDPGAAAPAGPARAPVRTFYGRMGSMNCLGFRSIFAYCAREYAHGSVVFFLLSAPLKSETDA